jgi:hypothetical protein
LDWVQVQRHSTGRAHTCTKYARTPTCSRTYNNPLSLSFSPYFPSLSLPSHPPPPSKETNTPRREANPDLKVTEVTTAAGSAWKEMTDEQKAPYVEQAAKAKEVLPRSPSVSKALIYNRSNKLEIVI